jgi:hypothetical protein
LAFKDADTVRDQYGSVRFKNLWAPEVQHFTEDGLQGAEYGGEFYADLYEGLARDNGYTDVKRFGEQGKYGRDLGDLTNENQNLFTSKLVYEGLAEPSSEGQREIYDMGLFNRAMQGEANEEDPWEIARQKEKEYKLATTAGYKEIAFDESELSNSNEYFDKGYGPFVDREVQYRHYDRDYNNNANSAFSTSIEHGLLSIQQNIDEGIAALGDVLNSKSMYEYGTAGAEAVQREMDKLPQWAIDVADVDDLASAGRWAAGNIGVFLPYMLGLVGTATAGALIAGASVPSMIIGGAVAASPLWVYAGDVYGQMEGGMDQKNAGVAFSAGVGMFLLDRLGLKGLVSSSAMLKKGAMGEVAEAYAKKYGVTLAEAKAKVTSVSGGINIKALGDIKGLIKLELNKAALAKESIKGFGKGALMEGTTEVAQESLGYFSAIGGSEKEFDADEYTRLVQASAAGGMFLGGSIKGVSTAASNYSGFKRLQNELASPKNKDNSHIGKTLEENLDSLVGEDFSVDQLVNDGAEVVQDSPESVFIESLGDVVKNMESSTAIPIDTKDINSAADEEIVKGHNLDKAKFNGGSKGLWQSTKEFPKRFVKQFGSLWEDKLLGPNATTTDKGKKIWKVIATMAGHGTKSFMQGYNTGETRRLLSQDFTFNSGVLEGRLYKLLNVGLGRMKKSTARKEFVEYYNNKKDSVDKDGKVIKKGFVAEKHKMLAEDFEALILEYRSLTDGLRKTVMDLTGEAVGVKDDWFFESSRLNTDEVSKDKDGFVAALIENGWSSNEANDFWERLINGPPGYDPSKLKELGFKNFRSKSLRENKDVLDSAFRGTKFMQDDPFQRLAENAQEQINYAVDKRYYGNDMEKIKKLLVMLKSEMGEDWDPRIASQTIDSISAARGDYKRMKSKTAERMVGHFTFLNTLTHLSLSTLASFPEAAIVLLGATRDAKLMDLIQKGAVDLGHHYGNAAGEAWSYIGPGSGVSRDQYVRNVVDFYRYGYGSSTHGAIGQVGLDDAIYKTSKIKSGVLKAFFWANGLKIYTDATRIARLALANDAIFGDLEIIAMYPPGHKARDTGLFHNAFERIRELNIDPDQAALDYQTTLVKLNDKLGEGYLDNLTSEDIYANLIDIMPEFVNTMDIARMSWVDNAIAHPDAMNRPTWYSNPYYRLFTQYNGFMSVFTSHILPKIWRRVKEGDPSARYNAVAVAASMIALGFLSQALKDEWKYDGRPTWITDKGYVQRGISSSGLIGTPEKLLSMISPLYDTTKQPWESYPEHIAGRVGDAGEDLLGPTWKHGKNLSKLVMSQIEGNDELRNIYLTKEIPIAGTNYSFKEWMQK